MYSCVWSPFIGDKAHTCKTPRRVLAASACGAHTCAHIIRTATVWRPCSHASPLPSTFMRYSYYLKRFSSSGQIRLSKNKPKKKEAKQKSNHHFPCSVWIGFIVGTVSAGHGSWQAVQSADGYVWSAGNALRTSFAVHEEKKWVPRLIERRQGQENFPLANYAWIAATIYKFLTFPTLEHC